MGSSSSEAGGGVRPGLRHAAGLFRHDSGLISRRVPVCLYCAAGIWDDDPHPFEFCTRGSRRPRFTRDKGPVVYGLCLQRRNHICRRATTACKPFLVDALRIIASEDLGVLRLGVMRRELSKAVAYPKQRGPRRPHPPHLPPRTVIRRDEAQMDQRLEC